jgi:putative spermidine/putrescine transport system substrate-binding protein
VSLVTVFLFLAACVAPASPTNGQPLQEAALTGAPTYANWEEVLQAAQGGTVNWFMWGGSDTINSVVDADVGGPLQEQFQVTLNRVPIDATADAVNKVLNEKAAGKESGGSIDLIWINGENFRTLKEANLLYGPFTALLPNGNLVNWDDPAVAYDFGVAIEGYESPWASFQWVIEYNSATVGDNPPKTWEALTEWIKANPGRFTYPPPPNHVGSAFVRMLFYWAAGGPEPFLQEFDQARYDELAPKVWAYLNDIEPYLWREGQTYPEIAAMADLLANGEIDFAMEYDASRASNFINQGRYPETIRTYVLETGTVANISYVAIPYNTSNPAAALVLANHLLSPAYQISLTDPARLGWMMAIDPTKLGADDQTALQAMPRGPATLSAEELSSHALPEARASWVAPIDQGWEENVLKQ